MQATKKVLEFSDLTLQGCNAFSWGVKDSIQLSEFSKAFKTATEQVRREGSMPKALQLARIALTTAQCKGPVIVNAIGTKWLEDSLDLLKTVPHKKLKKDERTRLQSFREQVMALNTEKIMKESLRFETVSIAALTAEALKNGKQPVWPNINDSVGLAQKPDFWQQFNNNKPLPLNWDAHAKTTNEIIMAIATAKAPEFKSYVDQINKEYTAGLEEIWKSLNLSELGFEKAEELKIEGKMVALTEQVEKEPALLKKMQAGFAEHPELGNSLYKVSLRSLSVTPEFFAKFDKNIDTIQEKARKLK